MLSHCSPKYPFYWLWLPKILLNNAKKLKYNKKNVYLCNGK